MESSTVSLDSVPMDIGQDASGPSAQFQASSTSVPTSTIPVTRKPINRTRKAKAAVIRDEAWERHKDQIIELHIRQDKTLQQVADIFQRDFEFEATIRQWRSRISKWGLDKKVKTKEMAAISLLRHQRNVEEPEKRRRKFEVRGALVSDRKITRFEKGKAVIPPITTAGLNDMDIPPDVKYWTASDNSGSGSSASEHSGGSASPTSVMTLSPALSIITLQLSGYGNSEFGGQSPRTFSVSSPSTSSPGNFNDDSGAAETMMALTTLERVGDCYHSQGRYKTALEVYRKLAKQARQQYGIRSEQFITAAVRLGETLLNQGRAPEAKKLLERSYSLSLALAGGANHSLSLGCLSSLCRALISLGQLPEAKEHHSRGWEISKRVNGPTHLETLLHHVGLADVCRGTGQLSKAISLYHELLHLADERLDFPTVQAWTGLAVAYGLRHDFNSAISYAQSAVERVEKVKGNDHPNTLSRRDDLTALYVRANILSDAEAMCWQNYERKARVLGKGHPETLLNQQIMVTILLGQNRSDEALKLCQQVLGQLERNLGKGHPRTMVSRLLMVDIWRIKGESEKAMATFEECRSLRG
ncbi:hypothetical protein QBC36DRAFT_7540 [Triangularia setosa]|uniref:Clr5 domain-containing protein n=1 Tax=Triangularia setosa TaxID=2587417 RepID=A0AAN6W6Z9_9PEZI|nr:hypothetical protein QBC36DRAFT_7540 [Podospora setosa]